MRGDAMLLPYNRQAAVQYAHRWAYGRNPRFYDYQGLGGDCTNFASQCLYAGTGIMNFTPVYGWYYRSANERRRPGPASHSLKTFCSGQSSLQARQAHWPPRRMSSPATLSS